jgi:hypothetical protein
LINLDTDFQSSIGHIREHEDRPYRCSMRDCDRRFATPKEKRTHESLHRIKNIGFNATMPAFAPPIANNPTPAPPVQETVTVEEIIEDEVKSDAKRDPSTSKNDTDNPLSTPQGQ